MDPTKIYPYVVPAGYLADLPLNMPDFIRPLGHNVYVILVNDLNGLCSGVMADELAESGMTAPDLHERAIRNLVDLAGSGTIGWTLQQSKRGLPLVVCHSHWLAATCILLPNLAEFVSKPLATTDILASIPDREAMILFPRADRAFRDELRQTIRDLANEDQKLITFELFEISGAGVFPFVEP